MDEDSFRPEWQGPFEKWARVFVRKNFWRVQRIFLDEEDALQECAVVFSRCQKYYNGKVDNPAWFMSLFKRAVERSFNTFAVRDRRLGLIESGIDPTNYFADIEFSAGPLYATLSEASHELKAVVDVVAKAPAEFLNILLAPAESQAWSRRLLRLVGIMRSNINVIEELRMRLESGYSRAELVKGPHTRKRRTVAQWRIRAEQRAAKK